MSLKISNLEESTNAAERTKFFYLKYFLKVVFAYLVKYEHYLRETLLEKNLFEPKD